MYGLPKTHKKNVPLQLILSMTGSAQHQLAKYLSSLPEPVLTLYSSNCIRDSFTFADIIKTSNLDPSSVFLWSFDISSLFTNVPLAETIQICADALYSSENPPAPFPRQIFIELMEMAASSVGFSFNDIMHYQIDEVAMGSPLGPALANIFIGYYESKLFQTTSKPVMYYRYMDDAFVVFSNEDECDLFLDSLNSLHPSLRFTFEKKSNLAHPFLDVLVEKSPSKFITSIYRKPTFTGQYLRWNSFSPRKHKTNLILTLTHRALAICSPERLPSELDKIKFILLTNGYPEHVIKSFMAMKMKHFHALPKFGTEKCPVYLRLPWLGSVSTRFEKQVKSAVKQCFSAVEPRVVYSTNELLPATNKDVLPALQKSNVIYQFSCHCDGRYVLPKGCRTESNNMSPNLSVLALPKNAYFLLVGANLPPRLTPSLLLLIQPLDFIFYKILPALNIMMTADFLFLPKAAYFFIYLVLKPLSSKLLTPPSADKKNSCIA